MSKIKRFIQSFGIPEFMESHLDLFFSQRDIGLVLTLDGRRGSVQEIADKLGWGLERTHEAVEEARGRYLLSRAEESGHWVYFPRNFYQKLFDYDCLLDDFQLLAPQLRKSLSDWCYTYFQTLRKPLIPKILNKEPLGDYVLKKFLPLESVDTFLEACWQILQVPCNCRSLAGNCGKPRNTCLTFNGHKNDRPRIAKKISRAEAKAVIREAHAAGLMQTVNGDWQTKGPEWMCNCDSCCCWPTRFGLDTGLKAILNDDHHIARRDSDRCIACGKCVSRCNFKAFFHDGSEVVIKGKKRPRVVFDSRKCWGCGICTTTCPTQAIALEKAEFHDSPNKLEIK